MTLIKAVDSLIVGLCIGTPFGLFIVYYQGRRKRSK